MRQTVSFKFWSLHPRLAFANQSHQTLLEQPFNSNNSFLHNSMSESHCLMTMEDKNKQGGGRAQNTLSIDWRGNGALRECERTSNVFLHVNVFFMKWSFSRGATVFKCFAACGGFLALLPTTARFPIDLAWTLMSFFSSLPVHCSLLSLFSWHFLYEDGGGKRKKEIRSR